MYLDTVEKKLLTYHESAGKKIDNSGLNGFYTISVVKRRIAYRTFIESIRESDNILDFTSQLREFRKDVASLRNNPEVTNSILSGVLMEALEEVNK